MHNSIHRHESSKTKIAKPAPEASLLADSDWIDAIVHSRGGTGKADMTKRIWEPRKAGGPEGVVSFGVATTHRAILAPSPVPMQSGLLVFRVNVSGRLSVCVDGRVIRLGSHELLVTRPGAAVKIMPEENGFILPGTYAWLSLRVGAGKTGAWRWPGWIGLSPAMCRELEAAARRRNPSCRFHEMSKELLSRLERVTALLDSDTHYRRVRLQIALNGLLSVFHEALCEARNPICPVLSAKEARMYAFVRELPARIAQQLTIDSLAEEYGMSVTAFIQRCRELTGETPRQYLLRLRMNEAAKLLKGTDLPISAIAREVGFIGTSRFYSLFRQVFGMTPFAWKEQGTQKHRRR